MYKQNLRRFISILICILMLCGVASISVSADTGPKPSVRILFENMGDELCYGTLLSKNPSTGPASVWNGEEDLAIHSDNEYYSYANHDYLVWKAFVEYEDTDGYYFLQESWKVSETKKIEWTYYPPGSFKILLYYPERDVFVSSGIYEKYAFDTYYTVDMDGIDISSVSYNEELSTDERLIAHESYEYGVEITSLIARIAITIVIEMAVALIFAFREKKQLLLLAGVNILTQIILNVLLNIVNFNSGALAFFICYILFELIVFAAEAVLYCTLMRKISIKERKIYFYVIYAFVANAVSFGAGMIAARFLPGIF